MTDLSIGSPVSYAQLYSTVTRFDDVGNSIEQTDKSGEAYTSAIVDEETGNVLAEAKNAKFNDISYCGFESDYSPWPTVYTGGNWNFDPGGITTAHYLVGRCSFHCSTSGGYQLYTSGALQAGKAYTVSYWVLAGGSVSIDNMGAYIVPPSAIATYTVPATGEVWTLYKGDFLAVNPTCHMWGEGYVDELKVYPSDCLMQTHNYLPLVGKTADVDVNDDITTYEHDPFGNLSATRDQNGNIISKTNTVIQGH